MSKSPTPLPVDGIAILGMAGRFPGAGSVEQFWRNLRGGIESITFFDDEQLRAAGVHETHLAHPDYVKARAALDGVELFDAAFFDMTPREAEITAPEYRLFLECAWEAFENAACDPTRYPGRIGVFGGAGMNLYLLYNLIRNPEALGALGLFQTALANDKDQLTTRTAYKLGLRGPAVTVQTACSTSLVAVHLACQSLLNGECDVALAGGVSVHVPQTSGYLYQEGAIGSPDGHCRAFDADARGTVGGSGVAAVVLKPLEDALEDGDPIDAVILGSAINNDGTGKVGFTAPSVEGQATVIAEALAIAGVEPENVGYVETHGTGTPLGDPIEIRALTQAFRSGTDAVGFCPIGSVKTNVGHLDAAAGVTGLIKAALALGRGEIPPSLHYRRPNPQIDFESSPFFVNAELRPWPAGESPRRAGVSSFGIGGTNAHAVLQEAPELEPRERAETSAARPHLLVLSARTPEALDAAARRLADFLERDEAAELDLGDVAHTLRVGRAAFHHRAAVVCSDRGEAVRALRDRDPEHFVKGHLAAAAAEPRLVFLFPGQGTQHPGMGRELYASETVFRDQVDRCCELLEPHLGFDLRSLLYPEDGSVEDDGVEAAAERLRETALAQPALFVVEYALTRLLASWGIEPRAMLGHSLGEWVAATLAGVFELEDALALVAERGRLMQQTAPGAMLSVELGEDELAEIEEIENGELAIAALNAPRSSVVSGPADAIETLEARLDERGVRHRRLHTSHAFHSQTMEPILEAFGRELRRRPPRAPEKPYLTGLTGTWIEPETAADPDHWVEQVRRPVRFAQAVGELAEVDDVVFLEVGPGLSLGTLVESQDGWAEPPRLVACLPRPKRAERDAEHLVRAVGKLWTLGVELDDAALSGPGRRRLHLPTYPFERRRHWVEPQRRAPAAGAPAAGAPAAGAPAAEPQTSERAPAGSGIERVLERQLEIMKEQLALLRGAAPDAPREAPPREIPLTPIEHWLFELTGDQAPDGFAQGLLLVAPTDLDLDALEAATTRLAERHEALRLDFHRGRSGWRQLDPGPPERLEVEREDLSELAGEAREAALLARAEEILHGFELGAGPLLRLFHFDFGPGVPGRLLVAAHHLAVDIHSWSVLRGELRALYRDPEAALPSVRTSFSRWAEGVAEWTDSEAARAAARYWLAAEGREAPSIAPAPTASSSEPHELVELELDAATSRRLLRELPSSHGLQPHEVLFSALAAVLERRAGGPVPIELEGHGREDLAPGLDPAKTVGWLTCLYPLWLEIPRSTEPEVAAALAARELRRVPAGGLAFGAVRYSASDRELARRLAALPRPEVLFHYFGNQGGGQGGAREPSTALEAFAPAPEHRGLLHGSSPPRPHLLEVEAGAERDRLRLALSHRPERLSREAVEALGREVLDELRVRLERCLARPRLLVVPASEGQRGLWAASRLDPEAARAYNETVTLRLRGRLDLGAFGRALATLTERHEALRTAFDRSGRYQVIERRLEGRLSRPDLSQLDLTALEGPARETELHRVLTVRIREIFDLERAPLWRSSLVRLGPREHVFSMVLHHLVVDGGSLGVLLGELDTLYRAERAGEEAPLRPVPRPGHEAREIPEADAAELEAAESYWREELRGPVPPLELPTDRPRPSAPRYRGARVAAHFEPELYRRLREVAAAEKATLFTVLLTAFTALLHHLSAQDDVVLGFHLAGQPGAGGRSRVGFFLQMLPLRSRLEEGATFAGHLRQIRRSLAGAFEHRALPFSRLVKDLDLRREPGQPPLVSTIFNLERTGTSMPPLGGEVEVEGIEAPVAFARFDLFWDVKDEGEKITIGTTYDRDLFDRSTLERWLERYRALLEHVARDPEVELVELARELDDRERERRDERREELKAASRKRFARAGRKGVEV